MAGHFRQWVAGLTDASAAAACAQGQVQLLAPLLVQAQFDKNSEAGKKLTEIWGTLVSSAVCRLGIISFPWTGISSQHAIVRVMLPNSHAQLLCLLAAEQRPFVLQCLRTLCVTANRSRRVSGGTGTSRSACACTRTPSCTTTSRGHRAPTERCGSRSRCVTVRPDHVESNTGEAGSLPKTCTCTLLVSSGRPEPAVLGRPCPLQLTDSQRHHCHAPVLLSIIFLLLFRLSQLALQLTEAQRQRCRTVRAGYLSAMASIMTERQALNTVMQVRCGCASCCRLLS